MRLRMLSASGQPGGAVHSSSYVRGLTGAGTNASSGAAMASASARTTDTHANYQEALGSKRGPLGHRNARRLSGRHPFEGAPLTAGLVLLRCGRSVLWNGTLDRRPGDRV
jgi:hypothetical protein